MLGRRSVLSGRTLKILVVSLALLSLATVLPLVTAAGEEGQGAKLESLLPGWEASLHEGSWTTSTPVAARGDDLQLSALQQWLLVNNVEGSQTGWTTTGGWAVTTEWDPYGGAANHCWSDSPSGDYFNDTNITLTSPTYDFSGVDPAQVVYMYCDLYVDLEYDHDFLYLEFSGDGGANWSTVTSLTGTTSGSAEYISQYIPSSVCTDGFKLRFRLTSDSATVGDGAYIDNMSIWASANAGLEETDSHLAYTGGWSQVDTTDKYGYDWGYKTTSTAGDMLRIAFRGTDIDLFAKLSPNMGYAHVSLDGEYVALWNYYWNPVWGDNDSASAYLGGFNGLSDDDHIITIVCSGTKQSESGGYAISFDYAQVWGSFEQADGPSRLQQSEGALNRTGTWTTAYTWSASGGSYAIADSPGSTLNVSFYGKYCSVIGRKGPGFGKAYFSVDGAAPVLVDLYSATDRWKQRLFTSGLLQEGSHTVTIFWSGQKNWASWSTRINVDALDIVGSLEPPCAPDPLVEWRYQQSDPKLTWLGNWSTGNTWAASGGSYRATAQEGAAVLVTFRGPGIKLVAKRAPWYGNAAVTVDGVYWGLWDFNSTSQEYKQTVFDSGYIGDGEHTLILECAGTGFSLDAMDITGYLQAAPTTTRIQEDDLTDPEPKSTYDGTWTTGYTWLASGGTFASASTAGAKVTVNFYGNYLSWVARATPWYGRAKVVLDPGTLDEVITIVDLYSGWTVWKKPVYNTGLLDLDEHTLVIECMGSKYWRSLGYGVGVDAFDILLPTY